MKQQMKLAVLSSTLFGLVACGGGGGSGASETHASHISSELKQQIKKEKVFSNATLEASDIPVKNQSLVILGKDFKQEGVELDLFPAFKLTTENWEEKFEVERSPTQVQAGHPEFHHEKGFWRVYNQVYSGVVGTTITERTLDGRLQFDTPFRYFEAFAVGVPTPANNLPTANKAHYVGKAFDYDQEGLLSYHVDFGKKEGYGEITGLGRYGKITLEKSNISDLSKAGEYTQYIFIDNFGQGITGKATAEKVYEYQTELAPSSPLVIISREVKAYDLQFFGPNAEEIGGAVRVDEYRDQHLDRHNETPIGFAGTKQ
ncbi:hypothetical protein A1D29_02380 [Pasteurellaceae bacterium Orientalotternb1]|nr:hypothetical protein A1D29_02380 [Pasteurellaceae bacterium Orientalotternb1]